MSGKRKPYAKTQQRRREIILAALECINRNGYTDASMEGIRKRAGASYGSVYHHFKSKEQLAAAVYLEGIRDYQQAVSDMLEKTSGAQEGVYSMVQGHLNWVEANPEWARYLILMRHSEFMSGAEESMDDINVAFFEGVGRFFTKSVQGGEMRPMPPELFISFILGPCMEFVRLWLEGKTLLNFDAAAKEISGAAWRALRAEDKET